jgi:histidinol phosphatase-like PHP family hydrolase
MIRTGYAAVLNSDSFGHQYCARMRENVRATRRALRSLYAGVNHN